jgi:TRAP-type uncharacterized transport system substrate-binding protein
MTELADEELEKAAPAPWYSGIVWADVLRVGLPALALCVIVVLLMLHYVRPAPPSTLTIASGAVDSRFYDVAKRYQQILKRSGITLKIVATEGSLDNLDRMFTGQSGVDIALVQSGLVTNTVAGGSDLISLGSMFYVPLTVFYRSAHPIGRLSELRGHRIAIGKEGSGTHTLAVALLKANDIDQDPHTPLLDLQGADARAALLKGEVEAIFLTGDSASSETIREMLHAPGVRLFDFPQADAYARRFRYLHKIQIPAGGFDLGENLPATPTSMLAPTVELVAHRTLHPALSDLLLEAATEVHGGANLLQDAGQFPAPIVQDFPISADANRFYKSGKSFAYRYLPFWLATLLDRALVVMLPSLLLIIPIIRYIPEIYNWTIRRRINRRYTQLMALERESLGDLTPPEREALKERLRHIETAIIALRLPGSHAIQLYQLRQHLNFVRDNLRQPDEEAVSAG